MKTFTNQCICLIGLFLFIHISLQGQSCSDAISLDCYDIYFFNDINNFKTDENLRRECLSENISSQESNDKNTHDLLLTFTVETLGDISIALYDLNVNFDAFLYQKCKNGILSECVETVFKEAEASENINIKDALGTYYLMLTIDTTISDSNQAEEPYIYTGHLCTDGEQEYLCNKAIPLACDFSISYSTIGAVNNFIYEFNYQGSCAGNKGGGENLFNAPDQLFKINANEINELTISMTDLSADLDLFLFRDCVNGNLTECIWSSTNLGTADEEISLQSPLNLGTLYLVVDGYQANQQSDFTIHSSCPRIETEPSIQRPSICEIPADFINNAVNVISNLSLDSSDAQLNSIVVDENILADFGFNIPDNVVFDAFIFFQADDSPNDFFGLNTRVVVDEDHPDHSDPKMYVYTCGCENGNCGPQFIGKSNSSNNFNLDFAPPGFYYIIVAEEIGKTYDLRIMPEGACGEEVESYELGSTIQGDLSLAENTFDTENSDYNIFNCYDGAFNYTGGDIIYQFKVDRTQRVSFILDSATPSGMFLYDFICGGDCLASAENVPDLIVDTNVSYVTGIDSIYLTPGIYHLVIDQAMKANSGQFILSSITETSRLPFYYFDSDNFTCSDFSIGEQQIILSEELNNTMLGGSNLTQDFEFLLYTEQAGIPSGPPSLSWSYPFYMPFSINFNFSISVAGNRSFCFFSQNDYLKIKAHNTTTGSIYDTDITMETPEGLPSSRIVAANETSIITNLKEESRSTFVVSNPMFVMPSSGGIRYFYVQADPNTSWNIVEDRYSMFGDMIRIDENYLNKVFKGTQAIKVEADFNTTDQARFLNVNIRSIHGFHQSVTVHQQGQNSFSRINVPQTAIATLSRRTKIYPNPASSRFTIQLPTEATSIQQLIFYDALGQRITLPYNTRSNYQLEVNTSNLPVGVYFMELLLDKQLETKKFSITR